MRSSVSAWLAESKLAKFANKFEHIDWDQLMEMKISDFDQLGLPPEARVPLMKKIEMRKQNPRSSGTSDELKSARAPSDTGEAGGPLRPAAPPAAGLADGNGLDEGAGRALARAPEARKDREALPSELEWLQPAPVSLQSETLSPVDHSGLIQVTK